MKNKKMIVGTIFVLVFFSLVTNSIALNLNRSYKTSQEELINIDFPIYINGNWSETVSLYNWCSGSGTEEDPWVIEGIHVTNENKTAHMSIENAEYFVIRNVIVSEYSAPYGHYTFAGLFIGNGTFGLIDNCTIINCTTGISLANGRNLPDITDTIKITNCSFIGSHNNPITGMGKAIGITGVSFGDVYNYSITTVKNVNISHNNIYNYYDGIVVRKAEEINIENNRIETSFGYISDTGIYFYGVNDSRIIDNDFYGCEFAGHEYDDPFEPFFSGLKTSLIENCYNLTIYGNRFYDLDGNLIGDPSDNISQNNEIMFLLIGLFIGLVGVCVVIGVFMVLNKRKSKI